MLAYNYNGMKNDGTFGMIDDLTISYDGNQLVKVTDDAEALNYSDALDFNDGADTECEYEYDNNGALTRDSNRGINSITYDYSHHPSYINMNMISGPRNITNNYTPDGRKLSSSHKTHIPKIHGYITRTTTDLYVDGLMLRGDTTLLWRFDGGYVDLNANGTPTRWNYYVTDHLGSTRMVVDSNDSIRETINYYPFGSEMRMEAPAQMTNNLGHPFRFTGKELDRKNSLNMYDFGARMFDVAGVPMWTSVDPLAEKYYHVSPYAYCAGDPVNKIDPDGREVYLFSTSLPGASWVPFATHTFLVVQDSKGRITYAAYGPKNNDAISGIDALSKCSYSSDIKAYTDYLYCNKKSNHVKGVELIPVPRDMKSDEFDSKVIDVINSFGNNPNIKYNLYPTREDEGNCNSSSSTILLKAGVSKETVEEIGEGMKGFHWGFSSTAKPWTEEEQEAAIENEGTKRVEENKRLDTLQKTL